MNEQADELDRLTSQLAERLLPAFALDDVLVESEVGMVIFNSESIVSANCVFKRLVGVSDLYGYSIESFFVVKPYDHCQTTLYTLDESRISVFISTVPVGKNTIAFVWGPRRDN